MYDDIKTCRKKLSATGSFMQRDWGYLRDAMDRTRRASAISSPDWKKLINMCIITINKVPRKVRYGANEKNDKGV